MCGSSKPFSLPLSSILGPICRGWTLRHQVPRGCHQGPGIRLHVLDRQRANMAASNCLPRQLDLVSQKGSAHNPHDVHCSIHAWHEIWLGAVGSPFFWLRPGTLLVLCTSHGLRYTSLGDCTTALHFCTQYCTSHIQRHKLAHSQLICATVGHSKLSLRNSFDHVRTFADPAAQSQPWQGLV